VTDPVNSLSSGGPHPAGSSRPYMPGYGVPSARDGKGLLAWGEFPADAPRWVFVQD